MRELLKGDGYGEASILQNRVRCSYCTTGSAFDKCILLSLSTLTTIYYELLLEHPVNKTL